MKQINNSPFFIFPLNEIYRANLIINFCKWIKATRIKYEYHRIIAT